ncbi:MAG: asparagine synthase (glutamine-hydrolyzing), partial [Acidimicrobiales bacterium]|nr:asparagine synthase (glutamine-hydrolyzing) [Acidimicrobiales bacterium]
QLPGMRMAKLAAVLPAQSTTEMHHILTSHWDPNDLVWNASEPELRIDYSSNLEPLQEMMLQDSLHYLPDDLLTKVDRAAMSVSLETRVPFLDPAVAELAWSLPLSMKFRAGQGKWILREMLRNYLPDDLVDRPKAGFGVPIASWLRGPLRPWAEDLLAESSLKRVGLLRADVVRERWRRHLAGDGNHEYALWDVLMLQGWWYAHLEDH